MKGLEGRRFIEQIRLVVDNTDINAQAECFYRVAELNRKGYKLVDSTLDNNEQSYILENKPSE